MSLCLMYNLLVCTSIYLAYSLFCAPSTVTICPFMVVVCKIESLSWSRQEKHNKTKISFLFSVSLLGWLISDIHFTLHSCKILLWYNWRTSELQSRFGENEQRFGKVGCSSARTRLEERKREWGKSSSGFNIYNTDFVKCILDNILKLQCDECLCGCDRFYN